MSRGPQRFTQKDLLKAMRTAQRAGGGWAVDILPNGTIRCVELVKAGINPQESTQFENREPWVF